MATFDITRPKDVIRLNPDGRGDIPFTVTNVTAKPIRARLEIKPDNPADQSIFTVEGGLDRTLRPNETQNIRTLVAAGPGTAAGSHKFWLKVVDTELPDDNFAESQSVEFLVPQREAHEGKLKFPWWIIPLAALLLLCIGGGAWYLHAYPKAGDYRTRKVEDAVTELRDQGFEPKVLTTDIVLDPKQDGLVVTQTVDGKPLAAGRLKRGTVVTLQASRLMPALKGRTLAEARAELAAKGFPQEIKVVSTPSQDPATWDKVQAQEPDPGPPVKPGQGFIQLAVSVKPQELNVPDFVAQGKTYCQAATELSAMGVNSAEQLLPLSFTIPGENERLRGQSPLGGQRVLKGGTVTLIHAGAPIRCFRWFTSVFHNEVRNEVLRIR